MTPQARYFDGRSARPRTVQLLAEPGVVRVIGAGIDRSEPLAAVQIGEQLGAAPRLIRFADGATCEVPEDEALAQWLRAVGHRSGAVDVAQRSAGIAALCVVLVLLAGATAYRWGLPMLADHLARRVPPGVTQALSEQTMEWLDEHLLHESGLSPERRAALRSAFGRLDTRGVGRLLFRAGPRVGPNAMALPDGRIVLLDELVALSPHDEEIVAVLAHELAHVQERHGLRLAIQGALVGAAVAWWLGDFGPLIAAAPAAILQARHSRDLEAQADAQAKQLLRAQGIEPARLADILERIARAGGHSVDREGAGEAGWLDYLATHPATRQRIQALRGEREPGDARGDAGAR